MELKRRKLQGVLNILSFNRHFYVVGLSVLLLIVFSQVVFPWPHVWLWFTVIAFAYGLIMPLLVSAYVYDYSGYYNLHWLNEVLPADTKAQVILNINAGFDETSFLLENKFPSAKIKVYDFYEPKRHTEPAIVRARKVSQHFPGTENISTALIPLPDKSADLVFLLSAAHEIRAHAEKVNFLQECRRVCKPDGRVVMVEHLRDFPNFVAFSVGFTHFFSRNTWEDAFNQAGFGVITEKKFTPYMSVFAATL